MNERSPLVSIIVPVYNVEKYLRECVDSILAQTYRNLEVLLIDDGSPDRSGAICDEYAAADPRVRVIHQANAGAATARNTGLNIAAGELISFIDSDDFIAENMIEIMTDHICREQADLVICNVAPCYDRNSILSCESPIVDQTYPLEVFIKKEQVWQYMVLWNKLYRRHLFDHIRFPDGFIYEDNATNHRILGQCRTIVTITDELYFYRQNPESIMHTTTSIKLTDNLSALADKLQYSYDRGWIELFNSASCRYAHMFFDLYFRFPKNDENRKYFDRVDQSLKNALPYLLRSKQVSVKHKVYLSIIRISPRLFVMLQRLVNRSR